MEFEFRQLKQQLASEMLEKEEAQMLLFEQKRKTAESGMWLHGICVLPLVLFCFCVFTTWKLELRISSSRNSLSTPDEFLLTSYPCSTAFEVVV